MLLQSRVVEAMESGKLSELAKSGGSQEDVKGNGTEEISLNASELSSAPRAMLSSLGEVISAGGQARTRGPAL